MPIAQELDLFGHHFWTNSLRNEESWMRLYLGQNPSMRGKNTAPECDELWDGSMKYSDAIIQKYNKNQ